jgi:hypothetical protein
MGFKDYFDKKFEEIGKFVEDNKTIIDNNEEYRKSVNDRIKHWLKIASLIYDEMTIQQFQDMCKDLQLDGVLKLYSEKLRKEIHIIPDDYQKTYEKGVLEVRSMEVLSMMDIVKAFDAEIIKVD